MFDDAVKIALTGPPWRPEETRVYPALTAEFESTSHRNIFVAGSASHGLDRYRYKASGGFIHGFRFNVQTLYRILDNRYERDAGSNPSGDRSLPLSEEGGSSSFEWLGNVRRKGEKRQAPRMDDFGKNTSWLAARSPLWQGPWTSRARRSETATWCPARSACWRRCGALTCAGRSPSPP